ncbi:MAG: hypothetical protein ACR2LM_12915, partial [Pyrinomonadaceae bacterium]
VDCEIATAVMIAIIPTVIAVNVILFITFSSFIDESIYLVFRAMFVLPKELLTCYLDPSVHVPTVAFRII